jgi:hypothetical protein
MSSDIVSAEAVHTYNSPGVCAHEFLLAVMHDPTVDLHDRMVAAEDLCRLGLGDIGVIQTLTIIITGGIGYQPTAEEAQEVDLLQQIWNSGETLTSLGFFDGDPPYSRTILAGLPIKGRG